jgi:predicted DNA-binding transcriptional regulator AlpA
MNSRFIKPGSHMQRRLRYADLLALGIVNNRVTLKNWIRDRGFPPGQLTGPNSRTWGEDEVQAWLDSRPTAVKPDLPKPTGRRGRPRKAEREATTTVT